VSPGLNSLDTSLDLFEGSSQIHIDLLSQQTKSIGEYLTTLSRFGREMASIFYLLETVN